MGHSSMTKSAAPTRSTRRVGEDTVSAVQSELEKAGAEFIADGVRRRPIFSDEDLYDEHGLPK